MIDNPNINPFDEMLKKSLEGTQLPVPNGVWESVSASIGSKAIIAGQAASIKLIILKTVAGIVLLGGTVLGIYKLLQPSNEVTKIKNFESPKSLTATKISIDTVTIEDNDVAATIVEKSKLPELDQPLIIQLQPIENNIKPETVQESPVITPILIAENPVIKLIEKTEPLTIKKDPEIAIDKITPTTKPEINQNIKFPEPPNVFTPDGDGINDCFGIIVENEKIFVLQILDGSGLKVFETTDRNKCWNGTNMFTGEKCKKGVYIYNYMYELQNGFKKKDRSIITLL